jgi:hypothetical protein
VHVVGPGGAQEEDRAGGLLGAGRASYRNDHRRHLAHLLGDSQRDLLALHLDRRALLLRRRQPGLDEAEGHGIDVDLELAPFLGQRLGQADHPGLGRRVVDLPGVAHRAGDRADVDDLAKDLATLVALGLRGLTQVRSRGADDPEGHDGVDLEHGLELLVGHLVGHAVPGVAGIVDDDVELAELVDGLLDELVAHAGLREIAAEDGGLA